MIELHWGVSKKTAPFFGFFGIRHLGHLRDSPTVHLEPSTLQPNPEAQQQGPEGPSTQFLRTLVPKTSKGMVFGARVLKYWVLGPAWLDGRAISSLDIGVYVDSLFYALRKSSYVGSLSFSRARHIDRSSCNMAVSGRSSRPWVLRTALAYEPNPWAKHDGSNSPQTDLEMKS